MEIPTRPDRFTMEVKDLIRQIGEREPLNPYQAAGMAEVIRRSGVAIGGDTTLSVDGMDRVMMVLDRAGGEASPFLINVEHLDSQLVLKAKFPRESLDELVFLTSFKGRQQAISENLIPLLDEIPNWLDMVRALVRYALDRDDEALRGHLDRAMEVLLGYLYAASRQPFDAGARSEAEYAMCRLVESILKSAGDQDLPRYVPYVEQILDFLARMLLDKPVNSFERRLLEIRGIRAALRTRAE